jgi:hypothetical protein
MTRKPAMEAGAFGLTDADITANQELIESNMLRFTCERAAPGVEGFVRSKGLARMIDF